MTEPTNTRSERYLRFSHQSMVVLLVLILAVGALCLAMAFRRDGGSWWMAQAGWVLSIGGAITLGVMQKVTLRGDRWDPATPEVQVIMHDEWRRTNMARAMRVAFVTILAAQIPIGLLVAHLPSLRAVMAMAIATLTLGLVTLIALFLFFSREERDG